MALVVNHATGKEITGTYSTQHVRRGSHAVQDVMLGAPTVWTVSCDTGGALSARYTCRPVKCSSPMVANTDYGQLSNSCTMQESSPVDPGDSGVFRRRTRAQRSASPGRCGIASMHLANRLLATSLWRVLVRLPERFSSQTAVRQTLGHTKLPAVWTARRTPLESANPSLAVNRSLSRMPLRGLRSHVSVAVLRL